MLRKLRLRDKKWFTYKKPRADGQTSMDEKEH